MPRKDIRTLPPDLFVELSSTIRGDVYLSANLSRGVDVTTLAVAFPLDAQDVSQIITFCHNHSLRISIKAGGYSAVVWAIGGDVIVDLSKIVQIQVESPKDDGTFTSIKDMPPPGFKGKGEKAPDSLDIEGNCKRKDDNNTEFRTYVASSHSVEAFFRPDAYKPFFQTCHQGLDFTLQIDNPSPQVVSSATAASEIIQTIPAESSSGCLPTRGNTQILAPSSSPQSLVSSPSMSIIADPFGYLNDVPSWNPGIAPSSTQLTQQLSGSLFAPPAFLNSAQNMLTYAAPIHTHAYVTFGAGMRQKEVDQFCAANPLKAQSLTGGPSAVPYHIPFSAHPVGSAVMLLGGFGFLGRLHGLTIDNLVEVEIVLADGRIVIANETEHPDLWWALRGADQAFGIVTRYKAKAFPVPVVFAGSLIYRFHPATAPSLIKHFRDCVKGAPRELYANILLTAGPAGQDSLVVIQMCFVGHKVKGQEILHAISSWDGESCLLNEVDEKIFLYQQDSVTKVLRGSAGHRWFIRSALISSLPDDIVNKTVLQFAQTSIGCTWLFELAGGALVNLGNSCLSKSQREAAFTVAAVHQWDVDAEDPKCVESAKEWIAETLAPVSLGGPFPSLSLFMHNDVEQIQLHEQFLGRHELPGRVMVCFGEHWNRLCEVKHAYDPSNFFRSHLWPSDASDGAISSEGQEVEHTQI